MLKMWNEWVAQWGIMRKKTRRGRGAEAIQEKMVLDRGERNGSRRGILLCALLGLKEPGAKVQRKSGQWYDVHADMFRRDNILEGAGQGDECWGCTTEAGQVPWTPGDSGRGQYCACAGCVWYPGAGGCGGRGWLWWNM